MSRDRRRPHALLAQSKGDTDEPFLPKLGQLYLVETIIYSFGHDPAADRRAVVITEPSDEVSHRPIQLVTRTSQQVSGVAHPADLSLRCDRDGRFSDLVSVERAMWTPRNVQYLGVLPEPYLGHVLRRFT